MLLEKKDDGGEEDFERARVMHGSARVGMCGGL